MTSLPPTPVYYTWRNDWDCWCWFHIELVLSVLLSFALAVENVWLIKIFQFLLSLRVLLLPSVFAASRLLSVVAQLTKMHFVFGDFISRMCYCPLVQINTFHAIYLLTWMVFFVKQIPDMLLYILYFLLLWLLVVSLSSFWFSRRLFCCCCRWQSFLDIYLYQIETSSKEMYTMKYLTTN